MFRSMIAVMFLLLLMGCGGEEYFHVEVQFLEGADECVWRQFPFEANFFSYYEKEGLGIMTLTRERSGFSHHENFYLAFRQENPKTGEKCEAIKAGGRYKVGVEECVRGYFFFNQCLREQYDLEVEGEIIFRKFGRGRNARISAQIDGYLEDIRTYEDNSDKKFRKSLGKLQGDFSFIYRQGIAFRGHAP